MSEWKTVVNRKKERAGAGAAAAKPAKPKAVAQPELKTAPMPRPTTVGYKKFGAGGNKQHMVYRNVTKLDSETDELKHKKVSPELSNVIRRGRQAKNLSQRDLATKINEKPQVIADYEAGRAIAAKPILLKIEKVIGLKLLGKGLGQPIVAAAAKK